MLLRNMGKYLILAFITTLVVTNIFNMDLFFLFYGFNDALRKSDIKKI